LSGVPTTEARERTARKEQGLAVTSMMRLWLATLGVTLFPAIGACDPLEESWCVDALEQVLALQAGSPVYKLSGGPPRYIEDAERPPEIARLQKIIRTSCSTDPKERRRQESDAYWLHVARSPECGSDLDMLSSLEQDSRNPKEDVERQRKTLAERCPSVRLRNRWLVAYAGLLGDPPNAGGQPH
jgi:hypothetical protein